MFAVLAGDNVNTPAPTLVSGPVPEITPDTVPSADPPIEAAADISTVFDNVPTEVKLTAPTDDTPPPAIFSGSATVLVVATSNVAPDETSVRWFASAEPPSAFAFAIFKVPADTVVTPE